jgi:hypothetical protein
MVIYDSKNNVVRPGNVVGTSDTAAGQWARIMAGILRAQTAYDQRKLWVVGFATVQNDKYLEAREYEILFPQADYRQLQENLEKMEMWQKEGSRLVKIPLVASIRPHVEGRVSARAGELITGDEEAWKEAACEYTLMMAAVARSLSPGYTTAAVQRLKQIADAKPNMRPKAKTSQKAGKER